MKTFTHPISPPAGWRYVRKGARFRKGDGTWTWLSLALGRRAPCRRIEGLCLGERIPFSHLVVRRIDS